MSTDKPWDRPWSMDEIIDNAESWSLAGDVALLNTLKSFGEKLIKNTIQINNNLQNLTTGLEEASLQLNLAQNEFQSLRNVQFIESRVYEDDETLSSENESAATNSNNKKADNDNKEENDRNEDIRLAISKGLEVLDKYYDKVEVDVSDSEDENDFPSYVLRPRDPYVDRPLPYVIGSEDWHKHWHVGLEDSDSDSETEKISDTYSPSESESDLPVTNNTSQIKGGISDTSSELDFSGKTEPQGKSSVNISVGAVPKTDIFGGSSDSEDQNSVPAQAPISNQNFAQQLAAKLGNVAEKRGAEESEVNKRPIQTSTAQLKYGDLFFDEPPPLESTPKKGLFSGGKGLFDDDEEEEDDLDGDLWGHNKQAAVAPGSKREEPPQAAPRATKGLFDEDNDEAIFSTKQIKPSVFKPDEPPPLMEEPPALDENKTTKKPVGGVAIFGSAAIGKQLLRRNRPDSSDEEEVTRTEHEPKAKEKRKKFDLFGDDDLESPEAENLFGQKPLVQNNKKKINLFDDDDNEEKRSVDNVAGAKIEKTEAKITSLFESTDKEKEATIDKSKPKMSLFDDDDDLFKDDLFLNTSVTKFTSDLFNSDSTKAADLFSPSSTSKGLFDDDSTIAEADHKNSINNDHYVERESGEKETESNSASRTLASNLFTKNSSKDYLFADSQHLVEDKKEEVKDVSKPSQTLSANLFDSSPESDDDLFSNLPTNVSKMAVPKTTSPSSSLFDSPPQDDLLQETKTNPHKMTTPLPITAPPTSLFESPPQDDLFTRATNVPKQEPKSPIRQSNLFGSPPKDGSFKESPTETLKVPPRTVAPLSSLFESPSEDTAGDLFQDSTVTEKAKKEPKATTRASSLFEPALQDGLFQDSKTGLFEPPLDDDLLQDSKPKLLDDEPSGFKHSIDKRLFDTESEVSTTVKLPPVDFYKEIVDKSEAPSGPGIKEKIITSKQTPSDLSDVNSPTPLPRNIPRAEPPPSDLFADTKVMADMPKSKGLLFAEEDPFNRDIDDVDDLFGFRPTIIHDSKPLFQAPVSVTSKSQPPPISSFDPTPPPDDDWETKSNLSEESADKLNLFEEPPSLNLDLKLNDQDGEVAAAQSPTKVSTMTEKFEKDEQPPPRTKSITSPGKLKLNLNINVGALMPGSMPPKRRETVEDEPTVESVSTSTVTSPSSNPADDDNVEILHHVTKDRAKVPLRRRPSTRRGRIAALKNTTDDYKLNQDDCTASSPAESTHPQIEDVEIKAESVSETAEKAIKAPPGPDLFVNSPPESNVEHQSTSKDVKDSSFDWSSSSDNVFQKSSANLFDDNDDEDDGGLFSTKLTTKSTKKQRLFDDAEDDDEDIFKTPPSKSASKRPETKTTVENKTSKVRKLANTKTDDDPLSALLD